MQVTANESEYFSDIPEEVLKRFQKVELVQSGSAPKGSSTKAIVVGEGIEAVDVVKNFLSSKIHFFIQKNKKRFVSELTQMAEVVSSPSDYFINPCDSVLKEIGRRHVVELKSTDDKKRLIKESEEFVAILNSQNVKESVRAIVEELYMNALLSAPKAAKRSGLSHHSYDGIKSAKITFAMNTDSLAISCEDPFGALNVTKFLQRMQDVYEKGAGQVINMEKDLGAGLGCVIMFEHVSNLIMGVIPEKCTVVTCVVPLGLNNRARAKIGRALNWVPEKGDSK
jgi:hypothetical protein